MSVLKNLFSASKSPPHAPSGPETGPVKMNLDERMEFRREMLYEAIRVTMQAHGILSASYKFRVVRNDKRGHQYIVLVDLSTDFLHNREGSPERLVAVGAAIVKNAAARYHLLVSGVYWQVNEQIQGFEASRPGALRGGQDPAGPAVPPQPQRRERATAEELAAFEAAWEQGRAMQIGDRVYSSDLAPLEPDPHKDDSRR
ncbi:MULTISPECIES: hypothetical protein [unclassified Polaromonas]|jgi:hypothetical protein|uniref:hypothetical protein n=1 Tax=unclassified Polaromonas TaxID=2638319 RepID=UPI000F095F88|nr:MULTISPECIES: hypothetical protein [unclassified Polaromonas]AYQ28643.1 hypothetical protein DT070_11795 [Polaromonas sp. SP1]QGJ20240.1 hypothetical protein F7R28_18800 [Polaromonas sp. Pch-P]